MTAFARSIGFLSGLPARLDPASLKLANACGLVARWAGDGVGMQAIARNCLDALSRSPARLESELSHRNAPPKPPKPSTESLIEALGDFQAVLAPAGVHPFLMFGSLLGPIRDGRFIPGDGDLDLGILGRAAFETAAEAVRASGTLRTDFVRRAAGGVTKMAVRHPNGAKFDVKLFEREADGGVSWHTHNVGRILRKHYPHRFELKEIEVMGLKAHIPDEPERFLEWQYGDWRTPDPTYSMITSGPLHGEAHRRHVAECGPLAIVRTMLYGPPRKFHAQVRSMAALFPDDPLWPRLERTLAEVLGRLEL